MLPCSCYNQTLGFFDESGAMARFSLGFAAIPDLSNGHESKAGLPDVHGEKKQPVVGFRPGSQAGEDAATAKARPKTRRKM
jgi:hypothetical protein